MTQNIFVLWQSSLIIVCKTLKVVCMKFVPVFFFTGACIRERARDLDGRERVAHVTTPLRTITGRPPVPLTATGARRLSGRGDKGKACVCMTQPQVGQASRSFQQLV